jgi:hypothetical protein
MLSVAIEFIMLNEVVSLEPHALVAFLANQSFELR